MAVRTIKVIMNGVTGRMGYRQHLVRSILPIRDDGAWWSATTGSRSCRCWSAATPTSWPSWPSCTGSSEWTTDLDAALADPEATIYFDAQVTSERTGAILAAIEAGKHIFTEKPIAESVPDGQKLVAARSRPASSPASCTTSSICPGWSS